MGGCANTTSTAPRAENAKAIELLKLYFSLLFFIVKTRGFSIMRRGGVSASIRPEHCAEDK